MEHQRHATALLDTADEDIACDLLDLAEARLADLTSQEPSFTLDAVIRRLLGTPRDQEKPPVSAFGSSL